MSEDYLLAVSAWQREFAAKLPLKQSMGIGSQHESAGKDCAQISAPIEDSSYLVERSKHQETEAR